MFFQKIKILDVVKPGLIKLRILDEKEQNVKVRRKYSSSPRKKNRKAYRRISSSLSSRYDSFEQLEEKSENDDSIHFYQLEGISPLSLVHKIDLNLAFGESYMFTSSALEYIISTNKRCQDWVLMTEGEDVLNDEFKEGIFFYALPKDKSLEWFSLNCEMVEKNFAFFIHDYPYKKVDEAISWLNGKKISLAHSACDIPVDNQMHYNDEIENNDYKNYKRKDHDYNEGSYNDEVESNEYEDDKYNNKEEDSDYKKHNYNNEEDSAYEDHNCNNERKNDEYKDVNDSDEVEWNGYKNDCYNGVIAENFQIEDNENLMKKVERLKNSFKFIEPLDFSSNDEHNNAISSYEPKKFDKVFNKKSNAWCSKNSSKNSINNDLKSQKSFSQNSCFGEMLNIHRSSVSKDLKQTDAIEGQISRINSKKPSDIIDSFKVKSSSRQTPSMISNLNNQCKVHRDDDGSLFNDYDSKNELIGKKKYDDNKYISSSSVSLFSFDEHDKKDFKNQAYKNNTTEYSDMGTMRKGLEKLLTKGSYGNNTMAKHSSNKENIHEHNKRLKHKYNECEKNSSDGDFESDRGDAHAIVKNNSMWEARSSINEKFSRRSNDHYEEGEKDVEMNKKINIQVKNNSENSDNKKRNKELDKKRKSLKKSREYAKLKKLTENIAMKEKISENHEKDTSTSNKEKNNSLSINKNYLSLSKDKSSDYRSKKDNLSKKSKKELLTQDSNRYLENIYQSGIIPHTNGSFEVDPYQEILVDSLIDIDPMTDIKKFDKIIKMDKYLANITHPTPLQSYLWPSILNLFDSFGIGPKRPSIAIESITDSNNENLQSFKFKNFNGGKTVSYILPLLYLLNNQHIYKNLSKKTRDPIVIILCPTSQVVIEVWKQIDTLLQHQSDLSNYSRMIYSNLLFGRFESEVRDLRRGCHILVTTPGSLLRVFDAGLLTFNNLCHLVFEEADILFETLSEQILRIIDNFHLNRHINLDMVPHQLLVFSQQWTKDVQDFVDEHLTTPVIAIADKFEALCYRQLNIELIMCIKEGSKSVLKKLLDKFYNEKVLIYTSTDKTAIQLDKELHLLTATSLLDESELDVLVGEWDKIDAGVCAVSDECVKGLLIEAKVVIHFDYPSKKSYFAERMWSLKKFSHKRETNDDEKGIVVCLVDEDQQKSGILQKLAPFLRKNANTVLPEEAKKLLKEKNEKLTIDKLCEDFKYFGFCFKQDVCKSRHYFSEALDVIQNQNQLIDLPFPAIMRIKVTHVKNPSCFYANLVEWAETPQTKTFKNSENKLLQYRMAFHYGYSNNKEKIDVQTVEVGNIYCYRDKKGLFHRVRIIKLFQHDPRILSTHAIVFLVDVGTMVEVVVEDLIKLHHSFNEIKFQAFEVVVCRIKPLDQEISWNSQAINFAQFLLQHTDLVGNVVAKVGSVVWMDPLEKCTKLQNLKIWSTLLDVRKNLLDNFYAEENAGHIEAILNASRQLSCDSDEEEILSRREKGYSTTGFCYNLEVENFENSYKDIAVSVSHASNPNTIFVRKVQNDAKLLALENEIKVFVGNIKSNELSLRQNSLVVVQDNGHWKRGKVLKDELADDSHGSQVFLVDYGSTLENVPKSRIYAMTSHMRKRLPFQAIECALVNLVPYHHIQNEHDGDVYKDSDGNEQDFENYAQINNHFNIQPSEEKSKSDECVEINDNSEWDEGMSDLLKHIATDYKGLPRLFHAHVYPSEKSKASINGKFKYGVELYYKRYLYSDNLNLKNRKSNGFIVNISQMLVKEKKANLSEFGIQEVLSSCDVGHFTDKCEAFLRQNDTLKKRNLAYALAMSHGCKEFEQKNRLRAISNVLRYTFQISAHLPLLVTITHLCLQNWHDDEVHSSKLIDTLCFIIDKGLNRNLLLHVVFILKRMVACERCCKEALSKGLLSLVAFTMKFWNWGLKEHVFYGIDLMLVCLNKIYKKPLEENQNNKNKRKDNNKNYTDDDDEEDADDEGDGSNNKLNLKFLNEELEENIRELKEINIRNREKNMDAVNDEVSEILKMLENLDYDKHEMSSDDEDEGDEMKYINQDFIQSLPSSHDFFSTFHATCFYLCKCIDENLDDNNRLPYKPSEPIALCKTTNETAEKSVDEGDDVDGDGFRNNFNAESNKETDVGNNEKNRSAELMTKCLEIINICIRCNPADVSLYLKELLKSQTVEKLVLFLPLCQDRHLYEESCELLLWGCRMDRRCKLQLKAVSPNTIDKIQKIKFQTPLTARLLEVFVSDKVQIDDGHGIISNQPIDINHNEQIIYTERTSYVYWCNINEDKLKVRFDVKEVDPNIEGIVQVFEDFINLRVVSKGELYTSKLDLSAAVDTNDSVVDVKVTSIVVTLRKKVPAMWNSLTINKSTFVKHDFEAMSIMKEDEEVEKLHMYEIKQSSGEEASDDFD